MSLSADPALPASDTALRSDRTSAPVGEQTRIVVRAMDSNVLVTIKTASDDKQVQVDIEWHL